MILTKIILLYIILIINMIKWNEKLERNRKSNDRGEGDHWKRIEKLFEKEKRKEKLVMKKMKIKFIAVFLVAIGLMAVPAYAEKISFSITVPGDTYSRKASKGDEEQLFYVTGVVFDYAYGSLNCYSMQEADKNVVSYETEIRQSDPKKHAAYRRWAAPGLLYRLHGYSSNALDLHVEGWYNP